IIRDLNVNSAIACPNHDEVVLSGGDGVVYTLRGYAYAGGGRRVTRVEITLDEGSTWSVASITYPEDAFKELLHDDPVYGRFDNPANDDTCFCWCFWTFEVTLVDLMKASSIAVRAMDESLALQ